MLWAALSFVLLCTFYVLSMHIIFRFKINNYLLHIMILLYKSLNLYNSISELCSWHLDEYGEEKRQTPSPPKISHSSVISNSFLLLFLLRLRVHSLSFASQIVGCPLPGRWALLQGPNPPPPPLATTFNGPYSPPRLLLVLIWYHHHRLSWLHRLIYRLSLFLL